MSAGTNGGTSDPRKNQSCYAGVRSEEWEPIEKLSEQQSLLVPCHLPVMKEPLAKLVRRQLSEPLAGSSGKNHSARIKIIKAVR